MRIIDYPVSEELIDLCIAEIETKKKHDCWGISKWKWGAKLMTSSMKSFCLSAKPCTDIYKRIRNETSPWLPFVPTSINYHVWLPGSGINWHNDADYVYGATLHLKDWPPEHGGIFMWKENGTDILHSTYPKRNTMVINEGEERHAVSPIVVNERDAGLRMSVQLFCSKEAAYRPQRSGGGRTI